MNDRLHGGVQTLIFVERLDLITWLEGAGESEFIKPLEGAVGGPSVGGVGGDIPKSTTTGVTSGGALQQGGRPVRIVDPRLQEIYNGERKLGDRNSVLRGSKPTVCKAGIPEKKKKKSE